MGDLYGKKRHLPGGPGAVHRGVARLRTVAGRALADRHARCPGAGRGVRGGPGRGDHRRDLSAQGARPGAGLHRHQRAARRRPGAYAGRPDPALRELALDVPGEHPDRHRGDRRAGPGSSRHRRLPTRRAGFDWPGTVLLADRAGQSRARAHLRTAAGIRHAAACWRSSPWRRPASSRSWSVQRLSASPLVDLRLFTNARLAGGLAACALAFTVLGGMTFILPFFLELVGRFPGCAGGAAARDLPGDRRRHRPDGGPPRGPHRCALGHRAGRLLGRARLLSAGHAGRERLGAVLRSARGIRRPRHRHVQRRQQHQRAQRGETRAAGRRLGAALAHAHARPVHRRAAGGYDLRAARARSRRCPRRPCAPRSAARLAGARHALGVHRRRPGGAELPQS